MAVSMSDLFNSFYRAGQINLADYDKLTALQHMFANKWGICLNCGNAEMFATHLVIVLRRLNGDEVAPRLAQAIVAEMRAAPAYFTCVEAVEDIEECLDISFPDDEKGYLYMHLNKLLTEAALSEL